MISIKTALNLNGKCNKQGERTIIVTIYENRVRTYLNTGLKVKEKDFKNGEVLPSCPYCESYNSILTDTMKKLWQIYDDKKRNEQFVTPAILKDAYSNNLVSTVSLKDWIDNCIFQSSRRISTKKSYTFLFKQIVEFSNNEDIKLQQVKDYYFVSSFISWMKDTKKISKSTIIGREKLLSCLLHEAVNHKLIKREDNPFNNIKIPEMQSRREYLDWKDIELLENLIIEDEKMSKVRDAFLFCCYTGLRFGDFRSLRSEFIKKGSILEVDQNKTGHLVQLPLKELFWGRPFEILKKYENIEQLANIGHNSNCNKAIQEIAEIAKIDKRVHWHLARHTCATLLNKAGMRMQEIQMVLGHQRMSTTSRIYAHTSIDQIQDSLKKQFKKLNRKTKSL